MGQPPGSPPHRTVSYQRQNWQVHAKTKAAPWPARDFTSIHRKTSLSDPHCSLYSTAQPCARRIATRLPIYQPTLIDNTEPASHFARLTSQVSESRSQTRFWPLPLNAAVALLPTRNPLREPHHTRRRPISITSGKTRLNRSSSCEECPALARRRTQQPSTGPSFQRAPATPKRRHCLQPRPRLRL